MADSTLNTDLPRRSILAVAAGASVFTLNPASAASNNPPAVLPVASRADALLLQQVAAAEQAWIALAEAGDHCKALCRNTHAVETLSNPNGPHAAEAHYHRKAAAFEAACAAAFETPAGSLQGLHARLRLALRLTREYDILDHPPYDWLETTLAELATLSGAPSSAPHVTSHRAVWEART